MIVLRWRCFISTASRPCEGSNNWMAYLDVPETFPIETAGEKLFGVLLMLFYGTIATRH